MNGGKYLAFEKRIQGRAHFASGRGYSIARRTVIESSMIEEAAMGIVEEEVGGALGVVCPRDRLGFVVEERERKSMFDRHFAKFVRRVVGIGDRVVRADCNELDAFGLVLASEAENLLANMDNIRTMSANEHHKQRRGGRQGRERNHLSGDDIGEGKIGGRTSKWDRVE